MPFFWAIIMSDDDMYRPLVGSIVGFVIMIVVWAWRGIRPEKGRRSDKEKIEWNKWYLSNIQIFNTRYFITYFMVR